MILQLLAAAAAFVHPTPQPPPELPAAVYRERRERVLKELGSCAAVLAAQGHAPTGPVGDYRQDHDFFWLTGVSEPGAWIVFTPKAKHDKTTLFLRPRDPEAERWTGPRAPLLPAMREKYGVDQVKRGNGSFALLRAAPAHDCLAIIAPIQGLKDERPDVQAIRQAAGAQGIKVVYKRDLIAKLRQAHGPEEIARMERAIAITKAGHEAAARATVTGVSERDVQTQIEAAFFGAGATGLSYGTIVGSAENGAVLHWGENSRLLKDGDIVVVDAAAEYGRYAADITRTFPVSGRFNEEQAKVYRAVYQAQEEIFAAIRPGVSLNDLQKVAEASMKRSGYLDHFIHFFGHFVGLDVHDAGDNDAPLPVGAIFTVEPGIYQPDRGFGVRIEDQVLIEAGGKWRLLSSEIPRKLEDVEAWVQRARSEPAK